MFRVLNVYVELVNPSLLGHVWCALGSQENSFRKKLLVLSNHRFSLRYIAIINCKQYLRRFLHVGRSVVQKVHILVQCFRGHSVCRLDGLEVGSVSICAFERQRYGWALLPSKAATPALAFHHCSFGKCPLANVHFSSQTNHTMFGRLIFT